MDSYPFEDLQSFIAACDARGEVKRISGAHWDEELGALVEAAAERIPRPPLILFDDIPGYPAGYRVAALSLATPSRVALSLGLPPDLPTLDLVRLAAGKVTGVDPIPPRFVKGGPLMDNVMEGDDIDVLGFPVPRFHAADGGRYIGTGDAVLNKDPESDFVNMGTYRIQVHGPDLLGLWMSPGQQGRQICERYWARGLAAPIAATFGCDPLTFMAAHTKSPWGRSELAFAGGLRQAPVDVIEGPLTGLPIPANAEIAIEGEVPPPTQESRDEGPFGEWPGYYAGGSIGTGEPQPVIRVHAVYHRNHPVIMDEAPLWPGADRYGLPIGSGVIWEQIESAGVQDVTGVFRRNRYWIAVSIRQRFFGHAKQAGLATLACAEGSRNGRYIIVVDDDIDVTNDKEVLWALQTRVDPSTDIDVIEGTLSSPLDPVMSPSKRAAGDHTAARAIIDATRPFLWKDEFPKVSRADKATLEAVVEKYRHELGFPI